MRDKDTQLSIWTTVTSLISEVPADEGLEVVPLRQSVVEYLVGEPLSEVGALEMAYSFTGISIDEGIPDAFAVGDEGRELSLVLLIGPLGQRAMPTVATPDVEGTIRTVVNELEHINNGSSTVAEAGREGVGEYLSVVTSVLNDVSSIRIKAIVLGVAHNDLLGAAEDRVRPIVLANKRKVPVLVEVVDIPTLQNQWERSSKSGTVDLVLSEFLGGSLPCLPSVGVGGQFETYLTIIPGNALADIYYRFKSRVLQKNLRNFLQATGKVNKGIQKTLKTQPERFLAYNNGLTITATAAELDDSGRIKVLRDFQIVNGGQTTASLDFAKRFAGIDLSSVSVQAKITVIDTAADPTFIDDVSNYANSQNKVKLSDFGARDSFQVALSRLMRDNPELMWTWDTGERNFWYYESFRGGYATAKHQLTGRDRQIFERAFPKHQVIDKLELARAESGWDGYPHFVCRGADKNFLEWSRRTKPHSRPEPDNNYCIELVAKVMILREIATRVRENGYAGFKSQIVAYTFSYIRFLLECKNTEIDLQKIWDHGHIPHELRDVIDVVSEFVAEFLPANAGREDPAQWSKKPQAWEALKRTFENRQAPRIYTTLQVAGLLRTTSFDLGVACGRAVDAITAAEVPLGKADLLRKMRIDQSSWNEVRRALLDNYGVIQLGDKNSARYTLSD